MACCTSGLSTVAECQYKAIVGALLTRRDDFEWGFRNGDALHVSYVAVTPGHRDQGVVGDAGGENPGAKEFRSSPASRAAMALQFGDELEEARIYARMRRVKRLG